MQGLSGMFRRSASLALPHLKSFAAIPSVSLVQLGHTNRSVFCHTNRSVKLPSFRYFQDRFLTTNKEKWGRKNGPVVSQRLCFDVSRAVGIARFESVSESQPHRAIQCHYLEDRNLLKLRSLDSSCPFFLSDTSIWGQGD